MSDSQHDVTNGHEDRDVYPRPITLAALALGMLCVVVFVLMQVLLNVYAGRESRLTGVRSPLAGAYGMKQPPEPRLQTAPSEDLQALRAREEASLQHYAWVDRDAGVVRIPIERAVQLLAERGLPARTAAASRGKP